MSRLTGEVREAAKPDPRVEDPSDRDEMDSILLLAMKAANRRLAGESGAAMREALQKLVQAAAEVSRQQQETPKPAAMAAAPISSKSCEYVEKKEEASPAVAVASISTTSCKMGCQMGHKIESCPKFLQFAPNARYLVGMAKGLCLSCLEERHGEDLKKIDTNRGGQHACR